MSSYHRFLGLLVLFLSLLPAAAWALLPDGLDRKLRAHNFNVYPSPFPANDMVLQNLKGGSVKLSQLRGKVVILNFWKIDCLPCSIEKPILQRLHKRYGSKGLAIVAVNLFDDVGRVRSYVQNCGFGFTFAADPERRFSIRTQALGAGVPTTFVVNSQSEAIYEVPGVPTTYVINRNGQVVGNSVGMINWEDEPFQLMLDSLLGRTQQTVARKAADFTEIAGQGPVASPGPRQVGPRRQEAAPETQAEPEPPTESALPPQSPGLPFQGQAPEQESPSTTVDKPRLPAQPGSTGRIITPTAVQQPEKTVQPKKKPKPKQTAKPADTYAKPKPFVPQARVGTGGQVPAPASQRPPQAGAPVQPETTYVPSAALPPVVGDGTPPAGSMSPLPPALPYQPPRTARPTSPSARTVVPDKDGNVTATIPSAPSAVSGAGVAPQPPQVATGLPSAEEFQAKNPIDRFLLDSFGSGNSPRPPAPQALYPQQAQPQEASPMPPASLLGQLRQDFENLGGGIRDTFSRVWPLK